jgi:hypothetical protein
LLRDNVKNRGSWTFTFFVISGILSWVLLLGKITKYTGDVDYLEVLGLVALSGGLYLGRSVQTTNDGVSLGGPVGPKQKEEQGNVEPPV